MLSPNQKRNIKEVLKYFIETTGCSVDQYILKVQKNARKMRDDMPYSDWLAVKSYLYLLEQGVCLADFLEYRNIGLQLKNEKKGINVASVWKSVIGKLINKSDISNYTLFEMSDLNSELNYISSNGNNVDIVYGEIDKKVNYFNIFYFDKNNQTFLNILPFEINRSKEASEEARLKYRYLDLRNPEVHEKILFRTEVIDMIRKVDSNWKYVN